MNPIDLFQPKFKGTPNLNADPRSQYIEHPKNHQSTIRLAVWADKLEKPVHIEPTVINSCRFPYKEYQIIHLNRTTLLPSGKKRYKNWPIKNQKKYFWRHWLMRANDTLKWIKNSYSWWEIKHTTMAKAD